MSVTNTSLQSYAAIRSRLGEAQATVYNALLRHPMASNDELADDLGWDINRVTGRTNELRKKGLVAIGGTKRSKRTGKTVQWMEAVT